MLLVLTGLGYQFSFFEPYKAGEIHVTRGSQIAETRRNNKGSGLKTQPNRLL